MNLILILIKIMVTNTMCESIGDLLLRNLKIFFAEAETLLGRCEL